MDTGDGKNKGQKSKFRERLEYAVSQQNGQSFKHNLQDALAKSLWLAPVFIALYTPIEYAINNYVEPFCAKVYRKIKGDPEAQMPKITQTLFKVASQFIWFPAIFLADTLQKFFAREDERETVKNSGNPQNPGCTTINMNITLKADAGKPLPENVETLAEESQQGNLRSMNI